MYPVSEAFLQAVQGNTRKYTGRGKLPRQEVWCIPLIRRIS